MKHNFSEAQLEHLRERMWRVGVKFEEGNDERRLDLNRIEYRTIVVNFEHEDQPKVNGTARYMAENYSFMSTMVPGLVRVDTIEEAHRFLDLVEAHEGPIDYENVLKCVATVHDQGWFDSIYRYVEDPNELPTECGDAPEWFELGDLDGAFLTTTINASTVYGSRGDIEFPKDDPDALLIEILRDSGEAHVELEYALEAYGVSGLEEFLVEQLLCTSKDHATAYIRIELIGGIFLDTVPENAEFLEEALRREDFGIFYHDQKKAIDEWTMATGLPEYQSKEWYATLENLLW